MKSDLGERLEVATAAAAAAGEVTLRYFQTDLRVETKADRTPVTAADREAEELLYTLLRKKYPGDGFLGEERGERPGASGFRWIVDPIDGTKSFVQGVPLYGVMVALEDAGGEAILGVVHLPALRETVAAARGEGCRWNGRPARVSDVGRLEEACVVYTSFQGFEGSGREAALGAISRRARILRGWGDCYGHILVATGRADVMLDPVLSDWDCAALLPILEEAGGSFTDWQGRRTWRGKSGISTNARLAGPVREVLGGATGEAGAAGAPAPAGGSQGLA